MNVDNGENEEHKTSAPTTTTPSTNKTPAKRSRKSFTMHEKIAYVIEYNKYCHMREQELQNVILNRGSTKTMESWLELKKEKDGSNIAKSTFHRWYQTYGKQADENNSAQSCSKDNNIILHKKRRRIRPFQEMETILVELLKVRNNRLHSQNKPISTSVFIRNRAEMIYKDMYGEEATSNFKCSNGWLCRFLDHYRDVLHPDNYKQHTHHHQQKQEQQQQLHQEIGNYNSITITGLMSTGTNHHNMDITPHHQQHVHTQPVYQHTINVMPSSHTFHHAQEEKVECEPDPQFVNENINSNEM